MVGDARFRMSTGAYMPSTPPRPPLVLEGEVVRSLGLEEGRVRFAGWRAIVCADFCICCCGVLIIMWWGMSNFGDGKGPSGHVNLLTIKQGSLEPFGFLTIRLIEKPLADDDRPCSHRNNQ